MVCQEQKIVVWPLAGGLIIAVAPDEFYVAGTGFVMTFTPKANNKKAGFISVDEGRFENGDMETGTPDEW